jgi:hypothetical protein
MICKAPSATGRLNAFQKVMLQWSDLHPYNAVHVYKVAGALRRDSLLQSVNDTCLFHGVGTVHLSADRESYRHESAVLPEVAVLEESQPADGHLFAHVTRELNRPFDRPTCHPFRFSAVDAGPQSHYVVLSYDHWVADAYAARLLMRGVLGRYLGLSLPEDDVPLDLYPETYRTLFGRRLRGLRLALAAARAVRQWNRNRAAWRVACWSNTHWAVDHRLYHTIPGAAARLHEFARSIGASVHDVFLAALGRAMAQVMPARGRPRGLALGSIVDTRGVAEEDLSNTLGAFLGYYLVRNKPDMSVGLDEAARQIAARTRRIKARHRYLDSLINMKFISTLWPWLSESAKPHFLRKALPMSGGISNVVVRDPWMNRNRDVILDYSRAATTGPMLPLVLSPTTLGDQLNVGVTYRVAGFTKARIDAVMELFLQQIEHPNKASRGDQTQRQPATRPAEATVPRWQQPVRGATAGIG